MSKSCCFEVGKSMKDHAKNNTGMNYRTPVSRFPFFTILRYLYLLSNKL